VALSPSIPTSFVPKQPTSTAKRPFSSGGNNILLIGAVIILLITLVLAGGTFWYNQFLKSEENAKGQQVIAAQASVNEDTINQLVRLQDRLTAAKMVLNQHIALTQFFTLLESITAQNVHFDTLSIQVADDRSAQISMTGEAQDFNALASQSNIFANQQYIKSAIFSGITLNQDGEVNFTLTANLDPAIVIESAPPATQPVPAAAPAASSTPTLESMPPTAPVSSTSTLP